MNWTKAQYEEYMQRYKRSNTMITSHTTRENKYRNVKVEVDGHVFDSKREAAEYKNLLLLQKAGAIKKIELQPEFELQPSFQDKNGKHYPPIKYRADFKITQDDGKTVVIDVKSKITEKDKVYRMKRKMLLFRYPEINFKEIF